MTCQRILVDYNETVENKTLSEKANNTMGVFNYVGGRIDDPERPVYLLIKNNQTNVLSNYVVRGWIATVSSIFLDG